jgi:hypothetical protein
MHIAAQQNGGLDPANEAPPLDGAPFLGGNKANAYFAQGYALRYWREIRQLGVRQFGYPHQKDHR